MLQGGIKMHLFRNGSRCRRARRAEERGERQGARCGRKRERIFNLRQLNKEKWPRGLAARLHASAPPAPSRHVKHGDPKENVSVWRRATRDARIEEAALRGFARRGGHAGSEYECVAGAALSDASLRAINDDLARAPGPALPGRSRSGSRSREQLCARSNWRRKSREARAGAGPVRQGGVSENCGPVQGGGARQQDGRRSRRRWKWARPSRSAQVRRRSSTRRSPRVANGDAGQVLCDVGGGEQERLVLQQQQQQLHELGSRASRRSSTRRSSRAQEQARTRSATSAGMGQPPS